MNFEEWKTVQPEIKERKEPRYLIGIDKVTATFGSRKSAIVVIDTDTGNCVLAAKVSTKKFDDTLEKVKSNYRKGGDGIKIITEKDEKEYNTYFKRKEE